VSRGKNQESRDKNQEIRIKRQEARKKERGNPLHGRQGVQTPFVNWTGLWWV